MKLSAILTLNAPAFESRAMPTSEWATQELIVRTAGEPIVRDLYSDRSAFIGSTREALRAGIRAASIAIAINDGTTSK